MVFFDNVKLPADALIGEAGKGAKLMFEGLNSERLLAAGAAIGLGDYALAKAVAYSKDRKPFGKPTACPSTSASTPSSAPRSPTGCRACWPTPSRCT